MSNEAKKLATILQQLTGEQTPAQIQHRIEELRADISRLWRSGFEEAAIHQQFALLGMITTMEHEHESEAQ